MKLKFKDRLKIYVFPKIAILLNSIGVSWERLGNSQLNKGVMLGQTKNLSNFIIEKNNKPQNIYVLLMLSGSTFHLYIETLLALGLKKKGHKVTFIIDDNTLPIHELKKIGDEDNWDYQAQKDFLYASKYLNEMGLNFIPTSKFVEDYVEFKFHKKYNSILEATLLKQYKVGVISDDLPKLKEKTALVETAIGITHAIGERLIQVKADMVIMSHGIYSTWGPPFQVLNENMIPTLVHGRGKKRHSQVFNWNKTGDSWDVSEEWEKVKDKDLTEKELVEINEYLDSRISHKNDVFVYNFGKETSNNETISNLGLDTSKPIYTLFTNVLWDAASAQREIVFKNPVEWVIETINWFNRHPEKQLIVKIHPAEVVIGTNMPFYDIIIQKIKPNSNIRIIQPKEKVNSWSIYDITDLGIVHTTTVGMEMPLVNKPCMIVSKTHYRNKGFTIDVNSKDEYFDLLLNFSSDKIDFEKNKKEALKYAYLLFIRYQVPFNMFFEEPSTNIKGFRNETIDEYFENSNYSEIINQIVNQKNIFKD
jgi:hypothetical protein